MTHACVWHATFMCVQALLYLNNFGTDFEGGEFEFIDNDANRYFKRVLLSMKKNLYFMKIAMYSMKWARYSMKRRY